MFRVRSKDSRVLVKHRVEAWESARVSSCSDPITQRLIGQQEWNLYSGTYESMVDYAVPNFHRLSRAGQVFMNPADRAKVTIASTDGGGGSIRATSLSCTGGPNAYYWSCEHRMVSGSLGRVFSGFDFQLNQSGSLKPLASLMSSSDLAALRTEVSTACLNSVGRGDSNLFESLAEIDKALGTVPGIIKQGWKTVKRYGLLRSRLKNAAGAYLGVRYGLMPMVSDVESIVKGIRKSTGKVRQTYRAHASATRSKTESTAFSFAAAYTGVRTTSSSENITIRAMSLNEYFATMLDNSGFDPKGLATVAWELVPYSFVADWFVNIGDLLGALVPDFRMTQLGSCIVEKHDLTSVASCVCNQALGSNTIIAAPRGSASMNAQWWSRTPGLDSPGLVIKSDFRFSNLTRALDAIALLVQQLRTAARQVHH